VWVFVVDPIEGGYQSPANEADWDHARHYFVLNQHLIDAARLEGIRLGLEAADKAVAELVSTGDLHIEEETALEEASIAIRALDPDTIAREAVLDQLTAEAQAQGMGYDHDDAKETAR
jgi:hypothetical protein